MIKLICGPKGAGKTKTILKYVDDCVGVAKGDIVYITDKKMDSTRINFNVRVLYADDFGIDSAEKFLGFINGLMAGNSDIEYIYVDGLSRIVGADSDLNAFFKNLIKRESEYGFKAFITISKEVESLPEFVRQYADQ